MTSSAAVPRSPAATGNSRGHDDLGEDYSQPIPGWSRERAQWRPIVAASGILFGAAILGIVFGSVQIPVDRLFAILASRIPGVSIEQTWPASLETILFQIRLPRVVLAGVVGAVLALAGATYQAVFRNPLADPYLIGVAGGAGLGATIAMLFPIGLLLGILSPVPLFAFAGALLAVLAAYVLARSVRTVPSATLILAGIAIASFASANTSFLMLISGERIQSIFAWILGGFTVANWNQVMVVVPYVTIPVVFILLSTRILDALQLDEEQARQMGVPVERAKLLLLAAASLATAGAVAVSGLIGFVGLIVPHAVRLLVGPGQRLVLPVSALAGAAFLILCDLIARAAFGPVEIPVGIVTAFCGAPFFLYLLRRRRSMIRP